MADLAKILHVSKARVKAALRRLAELETGPGKLTPTNPGFVAIARGLGVTPQVFDNALQTMKHDLATTFGKPGTK